MENLLRTYLEKKHHDLEAGSATLTLPVVTLSREYGCPSKLIAQRLVDLLNRAAGNDIRVPWRFLNKEIVEEAARELQIKTVELNYLLSSGSKGLLEDILTSFTPVYASNTKLKNILIRVISGLALRGHVVMVGRGSSAILQGHPNTLHVRLQAPLNWRISEIARVKNLSKAEALKLVEETDKKRSALIGMVFGKPLEMTMFDLIIHCERFSIEQSAELIRQAMRIRNLLPA